LSTEAVLYSGFRGLDSDAAVVIELLEPTIVAFVS